MGISRDKIVNTKECAFLSYQSEVSVFFIVQRLSVNCNITLVGYISARIRNCWFNLLKALG